MNLQLKFLHISAQVFIYMNIIFVVLCPTLMVSNGKVSYKRKLIASTRGFWLDIFGYPVGTVASFSCNSGYSLSASYMRTCGSSGSWTSQSPICNKGNENKYFRKATKITKVLYMSHFAYACKMRYPLNLVLENIEYL